MSNCSQGLHIDPPAAATVSQVLPCHMLMDETVHKEHIQAARVRMCVGELRLSYQAYVSNGRSVGVAALFTNRRGLSVVIVSRQSLYMLVTDCFTHCFWENPGRYASVNNT